jgi:hypothetical protein
MAVRIFTGIRVIIATDHGSVFAHHTFRFPKLVSGSYRLCHRPRNARGYQGFRFSGGSGFPWRFRCGSGFPWRLRCSRFPWRFALGFSRRLGLQASRHSCSPSSSWKNKPQNQLLLALERGSNRGADFRREVAVLRIYRQSSSRGFPLTSTAPLTQRPHRYDCLLRARPTGVK